MITILSKHMNRGSLGVFLAILSMLFGTLATIMYKPLMVMGIHPAYIGLIESATLVFVLLSTRPWRLLFSNKRIYKPIMFASVCQAVGSISFIYGLSHLEPVTFSFLTRNQAVFSVLLGYAFLKERYNLNTWIFILSAITGSLLLCYVDFDFGNAVGVGFALLFCLSFSLRNYILRKHKRVPVLINIFYGYLFTLIIFVTYSLIPFQSLGSPPSMEMALKIMFIGLLAVLGTLYFFQLSFRYENLAIISSVRLFSPFIIAIYFGFIDGFNYSFFKSIGIALMTFSIFTLIYSNMEKYNVNFKKSADTSNT